MKGDLWLRLGNYPHYFGFAFTNPKSGPDVDIMRIIAASKKCGLFWSRSILRPNNVHIICIIKFVNGVYRIRSGLAFTHFCTINVSLWVWWPVKQTYSLYRANNSDNFSLNFWQGETKLNLNISKQESLYQKSI